MPITVIKVSIITEADFVRYPPAKKGSVSDPPQP